MGGESAESWHSEHHFIDNCLDAAIQNSPFSAVSDIAAVLTQGQTSSLRGLGVVELHARFCSVSWLQYVVAAQWRDVYTASSGYVSAATQLTELQWHQLA